MNQYLKKTILFLIIFSAPITYSQITVTVTTDTTTYEFKKDIKILVTAHNMVNDTIILHWMDSYQSNYRIDNFQPEVIVMPVLTSISIPPDSCYSWKYIHKPDQWLVSPGYHSVQGMVINYGISEPVEIQVLSPTNIINDNNHIPHKYVLFQNHPNPFNPITSFKF